MKKLFLLLYFPFTANATFLNYEFFSSNDDDVNVKKHQLRYINNDFGIATSVIDFKTDQKNYQTNSILLAADWQSNNFSLDGNLGIGSFNGKNYLSGDMNLAYSISKEINLEVGVYGDLLDAKQALSEKISFKGINTTIDLDKETWGGSLGYKISNFSDGNTQSGPFAKIWRQLYPGINLYLVRKEHDNKITTSSYFSPPTYKREGVGLSWRQNYSFGKVSGFYEQSVIKTYSNKDKASAWKIQWEKKFNNEWSMLLSTGRDFGNDSGFNYRYSTISIDYRF